MTKSRLGKCRLCKQEKMLIGRSHIIPDSLHRFLKGESQSSFLFTKKDGQTTKQLPQSGIYEQNILCNDCESSVLGQYDQYLAESFLSGKQKSKVSFVGENQRIKIYKVENVNYVKMKLSILSILWRGHHSSHDYFKAIKLGPHEKVIREMILDGDPGNWDFYPMFVFSELSDSSELNKYMVPPNKERVGGHICYNFRILGFVFRILIANKTPSVIKKSFVINDNNEMLVGHIGDSKIKEFFNRYFSS